MAENIIIAVIVLLCLLLLARHFYRQVKGKGCGCSTGSEKPILQQDLPDLRAKRTEPPPSDRHKPDPDGQQ